MNMHFPRSLRRLLVMSGIAAANHRLNSQAETLRLTLPLLISEKDTRKQAEEVMLALLDNASLTTPDYDPLLNVASLLKDGSEL